MGEVIADRTRRGRSVGLENKSEVGFRDVLFARSRRQPSGEVKQAAEKPGREREIGEADTEVITKQTEMTITQVVS